MLLLPMPNIPPDPPPNLPLNQDDLIQAIAHSLAEKLNIAEINDNSEVEVIVNDVYPRYPKVILVRKVITLGTVLFLIYAVLNIFQDLWGESLYFDLGIAGSITTIGLSLTLILLLISEIFQGAGEDHELELKQGQYILKEYQFIPSLDRFSEVFGLLAISFLSIVLGFASLYTDLLRQNPEHFSGLQEGFLVIYFSIVTFSTVGYGDIHPASLVARIVAMGEIFIAMFFSLVVISTTLSWVLAHKRQQQEISIKQRIRQRKKQKNSGAG